MIIANALVFLAAVGIFVGTLALGRAQDQVDRMKSRDGEE